MDIDLTGFFPTAAESEPEKMVPNLDWLGREIPPDPARLPQQNLNIVPDLEAYWRHEGDPNTKFVQNTGGPLSMYQLATKRAATTSEIEIRSAVRTAMTVSTDLVQIRDFLMGRYGREMMHQYRAAISQELQERGLVGKVYVRAIDYPDCSSNVKTAEFVRTYASDAPMLIAKAACAGCTHNIKGHCANFHKVLVPDAVYTDQMADAVEASRRTLGYVIQPQPGTDAKSRVRLAMLAPRALPVGREYTGTATPQNQVVASLESGRQDLIAVSRLTQKKAGIDPVLEIQAAPVKTFIRQALLAGRTGGEVAQQLKTLFDRDTLMRTQASWEGDLKAAGLFGHIYTTQEAFDDCMAGSAFLAKASSPVRAVVAGSKCAGCVHAKPSGCGVYRLPLVASAEDVVNDRMVTARVEELNAARRLPSWFARIATETPDQALRRIHSIVATTVEPNHVSRETHLVGHYGGSPQPRQRLAGMLEREIHDATKRYLNEGLWGRDLYAALRSRFEASDLALAEPGLKTVLAEQGLQGIYYVDPTVYSDYGRGCAEASRKFRGKAAIRYAKVGDKCAGCLHQAAGQCSVLNKTLVVEPPYVNKAATQEAVLATGSSISIDPTQAMGRISMLEEYDLQNRGWDLDWNPTASMGPMTIEIGSTKVKV